MKILLFTIISLVLNLFTLDLKGEITEEKLKQDVKYKIEFTSNPLNVDVFDVNDVYLGITPFTINLTKGYLKVKFEKNGYETVEKNLYVKQNEKISVELNEKFYDLMIDSDVLDAKVYIDDKITGKIPFSTKLKQGVYKVKVTKNGYEDKEETITIKIDTKIVMQIQEKKIGKMVNIKGKKFKMDVTEVTNGEYQKCVKAGKCQKQHYDDGKCVGYLIDHTTIQPFYNNSSNTHPDNTPVTCVYFQEAKNYCKWLGKRLPTEDEWEYAAKGNQNYIYAGSDDPSEVAWIKDSNSKYTTKIYEVGTKKANGYGLYDMSGNVREWTNSWNDKNQNCYVLRGGNFESNINDIRVDSRMVICPRDILDLSLTGFRCVQDVK
ncbi:SUMF1/EgtB/PvdO family nonheme iron enzyme [bacterium]|nr:SUMF1/EgtB/PvdO family nonheme iron enzyme [bacterium]